MKFELPIASRQRLDELLEYLGDRAEDFKKCFDIKSEWCWKYADIVLRGLNKKSGSYIESHHIIPIAFYLPGNTRKVKHRFTAKYTIRNLTGLDCAEHIMAHYCMAKCANGDPNVHAMAFLLLYRVYKKGVLKREHDAAALFSEENMAEIRGMLEKVKKVTEEGRTHKYTDEKGYKKDWREANIERIRAYDRERNSGSRRGYMKEYLASYWKDKKPKLQKYRKDWAQKNEEHLKQYQHDRYAENHDEIRAQQKNYRDAKKAAGYRYRKDPITGKHCWIFVGIIEQDAA